MSEDKIPVNTTGLTAHEELETRTSFLGDRRGRFKPTGFLSDTPPVLALKEKLQIAFEEFHEDCFAEFEQFWENIKNATAAAARIYPAHPYPQPPPPILSWDQTAAMPNRPGVYFVWNTNVISYVGQSSNLAFRCRVNCHPKITEGDWISWIEVPLEELYFTECFYIGALRPTWNFGRGVPPK